MLYDFTLAAGDLLPDLVVEVDGISTLAESTVTFTYRRLATSAEAVTKDAELVGDGSTCRVKYVWEDGDTDVAGEYEAWFTITTVDLRPLSAPNGRKMRFKITAR